MLREYQMDFSNHVFNSYYKQAMHKKLKIVLKYKFLVEHNGIYDKILCWNMELLLL